MSYSTMARALISYVEGHLENFDFEKMSDSFSFSEIYLRELFLKNVGMPIMQYYKKRRIMMSAFEILHSDKKIIDIALESGFSNHESYTRAFRKLFGMSPSAFRKSRPLMGRKQLDMGVFGLEKLANKEKRSDVCMVKQDGNQTILYGVRKIVQGLYDSQAMFPICVKAVSEYLGDDVSYAYIMAVTGAAFRLTWNRETWDLCNIDIYHTLKESNDIYQYGAKALGREFAFLERTEATTKEEFVTFMKSHIAKGFPVIALGVIGPPEPCIVAGYESAGEVVMGWNFFQEDAEYSSNIRLMDNGYFQCDSWWENTDTQAVMCMGAIEGKPYSQKEIITMAAAVMEARDEGTYAKGLRGYEAWKEMLLDETWFENGTSFDSLFSKLLVQNDAMVCISDGRKWGAKYFEELSGNYSGKERVICQDIANHFREVSRYATEMLSLIGDWSDTEHMLQRFGERKVREELAQLIDAAHAEDKEAYEQIKRLCSCL